MAKKPDEQDDDAEEKSIDEQILDRVEGIDDEEDAGDEEEVKKSVKVEEESEEEVDKKLATDLFSNKQIELDKTHKATPKIDPKTGKPIAEPGADRRHYANSVREKARADGLQRENETLKAQLEGAKQAGTIGTQLGLKPDEVVAGAKIIAAFKEDPVSTVKYLLTEAQKLGHNIESIGQGTDVKAIKALLDERLAPFAKEREDKQKQEEIRAQAKEQYDTFVSMYPDAVVHTNTIAELLERDTTGRLTADAAYFQLKTFYLERGLDWSKPLEVLEEEQKKGVATQVRPGIPSGRKPGPTTQAKLADVDTSIDDIIRESMQEAGIGSTN